MVKVLAIAVWIRVSTWPVGPPSRDAARRLGDQHLRGKEAAVSTGVLSCFGAAFVGFHIGSGATA